MGIFPKFRDENKKYLKFHHLVMFLFRVYWGFASEERHFPEANGWQRASQKKPLAGLHLGTLTMAYKC